MRSALRVMTLALAVALATAWLGWWSVPAVAALGTVLSGLRPAAIRRAALGGALGWALLLGWTALHGPVGEVARRLAGVFALPVWALVVLTLAFPALLAGCAAAV